MSLKIGIVTRYFLPEIGGITYAVYYLSRELARTGHQVTVYSIKKSVEQCDEEWIDGIHVKRFRCFTLPVGRSQEFSFQLLRLLLKDDLDLIHVHTPGTLGSLVWFASFIKRLPYFLTIHAFGDIGSNLNILEKMLRPIHHYMVRDMVIKKAKAVFCESKDEARQILEIKGNSVYHIPLGADLEMFDSSPSKFRDEYNLEDKMIILNVGRIGKQKAQLTLVKALPEVIKRFPSTICVFVGPRFDEEYYNEIEKEIRQRSLDNHVIFTGGVNMKETPSIYKSCDLFVLTSVYESFGLVVAEAWAARKPVVVSDVVEIVTDKVNGVKFVTGNPSDLVEKISSVLSDKEVMKKLSENGRKEVEEHYTWDKCTRMTEEHYLRALG